MKNNLKIKDYTFEVAKFCVENKLVVEVDSGFLPIKYIVDCNGKRVNISCEMLGIESKCLSIDFDYLKEVMVEIKIETRNKKLKKIK